MFDCLCGSLQVLVGSLVARKQASHQPPPSPLCVCLPPQDDDDVIETRSSIRVSKAAFLYGLKQIKVAAKVRCCLLTP